MCEDLRFFEIIKDVTDYAAPLITIAAGLLALFKETHQEKTRSKRGRLFTEKVLTKWAWVAMIGIILGGTISIVGIAADKKIDAINKCLADNQRQDQERQNFLQDSTYKANTMAAEYGWFSSLAGEIYLVSESSTFLNDAELDDPQTVISGKFKTTIVNLEQKMKTGLQSPFLQRHADLRDLWDTYSKQMSEISTTMYRITGLSKVEQNGWWDRVGRWGVAYEALYTKIPEYRIKETSP
ncbi:MAG: hypothetical protein WCF67_17980 [Chitinophagaceae bacterium]